MDVPIFMLHILLWIESKRATSNQINVLTQKNQKLNNLIFKIGGKLHQLFLKKHIANEVQKAFYFQCA